MVLITPLFACEAWTVYQRHARQLNHFHTICLCRILKTRWQDKVPDTAEVLSRANQPSIHTLLMRAQIRWAGHIVRMPDERIPKQLLYGDLCIGKRSVGGQRKRFKDTLKTSLKSFSIDTSTWEQLAVNRTTWRELISKGCQAAEDSRRTVETQQKQELCKARVASTSSTPDTSLVCPPCARSFRAKIGLTSHISELIETTIF